MEKERKIDYTISSEYSGKKISDYLKWQGISTKCLIRLKTNISNVCLNGEPGYVNRTVSAGDILTIYIREHSSSEKIPPVDLPFAIVYEDEDLLVVNKPADMPIHPSLNNYENTLGNAAAFYFSQKGEPFIYRCINRLDRDTSGLTILAKHYLSAGLLYDAMEKREIKRTYYAIVERKTRTEAPYAMDLDNIGTIDLPIGRKNDSAIERTVDYENGDQAVTHYRILDMTNEFCLLELQLDTGRTHQIRVHMQTIGHPLIGDFLYNPTDTHMKRQALHAGKLAFAHPITKKTLEFSVDFPEDMQKFFSHNI